jgi:molecular chaperone GrpE
LSEKKDEKEVEKKASEEETKEVNEASDKTEKDVSPEEAAGKAEESESSEEGAESEAESLDEKEAKKAAASREGKEADKYKKEAADWKDKYTRQLAEFENFRNRSEKEKAMMFDTGAVSILQKILPVVDNFERGLETIPEDKKDDPFVTGMDKVYKMLTKALTDAGVEPIEAKGAKFDPNLHNAVMHAEDDSVEENTIVEELQKGYKYHETVIRPSMVKVAN